MAVPLRAIGVFHAVARAASISKAAAELGVTPSAVSQQIHSLEVLLGTTLLVKAGRRIKLTEAAERFFEMIAEGVEHIAEATDRIRGRHTVTALTVRATPTLATKWLLPRLASFIDSYPQFELRLDGTNEPTDFSREDVDIEIRHGEGNWPGLFVEGVAEERFLPVCSRAFAKAATIPIGELVNYRLIHSVKAQVQWPVWLKSVGALPDRRWRRVSFDRSHMAIDAAVTGMGIALESNLMMWRELRDGSLVCPVIDPPSVTLVTQWLVCPHDHLRHAKVRAFIDWVRAERDKWAGSQRPAAKLRRSQPN
jgi:LysR family transcriptional regulator, glycine cleavage system transcriptional activator